MHNYTNVAEAGSHIGHNVLSSYGPFEKKKEKQKTEKNTVIRIHIYRPNLVSRLDVLAGTLSDTHWSLMYSVSILLHILLISYECFEHFSGSLYQHAQHQPGGGFHSDVILTASGGVESWFVRE